MSQIGVVESSLENGITNFSFRDFAHELSKDSEGNNLSPFEDENPKANSYRVTVLLIFSVIGLLGNFLTILLVAVTKQLQKPTNSFFIHHCILDIIKSGYCFAFGKVRAYLINYLYFNLLLAEAQSQICFQKIQIKILKVQRHQVKGPNYVKCRTTLCLCK